MENLLQVLGSISFGTVIGYVASLAVQSEGENISLKYLGAFLGIVGGGAITSLFPATTSSFSGYSFGLGLGFVSLFISNGIKTYLSKKAEKEELSKIEHEKELKLFNEVELPKLNEQWDEIENYISKRLDRKGKVSSVDLFPYSKTIYGRMAILETYAKLFVDQNIHLSNLGHELYRISAKSSLKEE